ncbi:DUF2061 domain-containing protein [Thalassobellus suaedae]|uniref:DUF2061 domain-containing protein n=1 Tax=Thalassobellus suaedae TaxID=3074124 RepID=A0ABY9Y4S4_9FLAO|nr:DUF2061 domain-containing protein [Flavobacteriaceae bacterium HL-DH10]
MADDSHKRHVLKAITWRLVGTLDTIILSTFISGDATIGLKIGISEFITKMILYYFHERIWYRFNLPNSKKRHILKTFSWRFIGSLDTFILSWIISGNPLTGLKIGIAEVLTKMILYYLHERIWYGSNFGLEKKKKNRLQR